MTSKERSAKELAGYFVLGILISFATTAIFGNVVWWLLLAIAFAPSIIIIAIKQTPKSRSFSSSIGHAIPYSIAMFVFEQPVITILEESFL